jgi:hypothetical protein
LFGNWKSKTKKVKRKKKREKRKGKREKGKEKREKGKGKREKLVVRIDLQVKTCRRTGVGKPTPNGSKIKLN